MEKEIIENTKLFFDNYPELATIGEQSQQTFFQKLKRKIQHRIPNWYCQLLEAFPLAALPIAIPFNYGWESLKNMKQHELPFMETQFNTLAGIDFLAKETFPSFELIKANYICIAENTNQDGDGFYINSKQKNPSVIYIHHDCGNTASELIENAQLISESFSDFLQIIRPVEFADKWLDEHEHLLT